MPNLVLDNIVYRLQRAGGISVVWSELIRRLMADGGFDVRYLERITSGNIFRAGLSIPHRAIVREGRGPVAVRCWINPHLNGMGREPFLFHSSYYRTCPNSNAVNITTVHDFTSV